MACIQHNEPLFYEHDGEQVSFPGNSALFNVKSLRNTLSCPISHSPKIEAQQAFFDLLPVHRGLRGVVDVCPITGRRFLCGASSGHGAGGEGWIRSKATPTRNRRTRTAFPGNSSARPYPDGGGATASGEKNGTRSVPIGSGGGTAAATHRSGGFRTFRKLGRERALPSTVLAAFPFCLPGIAAHLRMFRKMPLSFPCPYDEAHVAAQGHLAGMTFAAHLFQSRILMKTYPDCVSVPLWHFKDERLFSEHTGVAGVHPETA